MSETPNRPARYRFADLSLDPGQRRVWRGDEPIELSKLSFDLLWALVEAAPNAIANDDLASKVWGPRRIVTPENLSRRLLLLREGLGDDSSSPRYVGGVRGYGYRLIPLVEKLPAPDGEHLPNSHEAPVDRRAAPRAGVARAAGVAGVAGTVLLLTALAWWAVDSRPGDDESAGRKSIAVLPFADLSETQDQAWLGDGIAEDLTTILTRNPQFRVAARNSAFALRGQELSALEIGQALGVRYLLGGSTRRDGNRLRIGAWLVDSATNTQLWAFPQEREVDDVFQAQLEIAAAVADALRIQLLAPLAPIDTTTQRVDDLVTEAEYIVRNAIVPSLPRAVDLLKQAIELDRSYLPARMALAYAYGDLPRLGEINWTEARELVARTLDEAEAIWPERAEVDAARGLFAVADGDLEAAADYLERAFALEPEDDAVLMSIVTLAIALDRAELAVTFGEYVLQRNRLCGICRFHLLRAYVLADRFAEAEELYESSHALNLATDALFPFLRGTARLQSGDAEGALDVYRAMDPRGELGGEVYKLTGLAMALHTLGQTAEFEAEFHELVDRYGTIAWINVAAVHAHAGDLDSAFEVLRAAGEFRPEVLDMPPLTRLREHAGWREAATNAGIWPVDPRERIVFDVALPEY